MKNKWFLIGFRGCHGAGATTSEALGPARWSEALRIPTKMKGGGPLVIEELVKNVVRYAKLMLTGGGQGPSWEAN